MKKTIGLCIVLFFLINLLGPAAAFAGKEKDKYKNWLKEEVALIILPEEKEAFQNLTTAEEKDRFIELFWAKRDPFPETKENEFRTEWYERLEHVNKAYSRGSVSKGWHTDMGRVYMIFGPPLRFQVAGGAAKSQSSGGSQIAPPTEYWEYKPIPELGLYDRFKVVFINYQYGYELDVNTNQQILRALEIFPRKIVVNPDLKELHQ